MNRPSDMPPDQAILHAYLCGALSEAEAEDFEKRLFADDELAKELQRAVEIRAAAMDRVRKPDARDAGRSGRRLLPLAIAAGAAMLAAGLYWLQTPPTPVYRGIEQRAGLELRIAGGEVRAEWAPVPGAAGYELGIYAGDGRLLHTIDADASPVAFDFDAVVPSGSKTYVEVVALDDLGQTLARTERVELSN